MGQILPSEEGLAALTGLRVDGPIVMINLLRYREQADYPPDAPEGLDTSPCSGREAYQQRYGAVAQQTIAEVGGRLLWAGGVEASVIAAPGEVWDDAVLVEYPSRDAFVKMISMPRYQACAPHRTAALADSRLICTVTRAGL